jgi:hypothetical protein
MKGRAVGWVKRESGKTSMGRRVPHRHPQATAGESAGEAEGKETRHGSPNGKMNGSLADQTGRLHQVSDTATRSVYLKISNAASRLIAPYRVLQIWHAQSWPCEPFEDGEPPHLEPSVATRSRTP